MRQIVKAILFCLFFGPGLQAAELLERRIDVRFQQAPLKEALAAVAQKAGFEWSYNTSIIDAAKRITLIANDWTVRETLYELLGEGYEFKTNGNYLILKKRKRAADQLSGYVKDRTTGQRVANATVYDRRTLRSTTTDSNGYYELRVKKSTQIAIARLDYRDTIFALSLSGPRFQKFDLQVNTTAPASPPGFRESLQRAATMAECFFRASLDRWNGLNVPDSLHRRFQLSLLPKIGTNHTLSSKVINDWSVNLLTGVSLGNRRAELGGLGNFTRRDMTGLQAGGIFNELHGSATGVQLAGIYNHVGDNLRGIQAGGLFNVARQTQGFALQLGGFANHAGQIRGLQAAGGYNYAGDTLRGIQLSGGVNIAQHSAGLSIQVGGVANRAGQIHGLQVAGIINTADTLQGIQVSALCNRARKVKGLQFGIINSARELEGLQIGLINRSGRRVLPLFNW